VNCGLKSGVRSLKPVNPGFEPIVLTGKDEGERQVIAEFLEVLGSES
jgi:hypothetical protein